MLAAACWPGPLTLLVRALGAGARRGHRGRDTVGVRVPAHPLTQELLRATGLGVAAPSANRFGQVSPTTAQHVLDDLGPYLDPARDIVLDGGPAPIGVESTIVDCTTDPPQLLRPGGIPPEDVERILDLALGGADRPVARRRDARVALRPPGPGRARARPVRRRRGRPRRPGAPAVRVAVIDHGADLVGYARDLYAELRAADDAGVDDIVAVLPPPRGLGHAIRDRLTKAAAQR